MLNILVKLLDKEQEQADFNEIGVKSGSAFVNNFSLLFSILMIVLAHLLLILLPRKSVEDTEDMTKTKKIFYYISRKLWAFFTFTVYVRLIMEAYQFMLLSSVYEIYSCDISNIVKLVSYGIACILALLCVLCFFFVIIMAYNVPINDNYVINRRK